MAEFLALGVPLQRAPDVISNAPFLSFNNTPTVSASGNVTSLADVPFESLEKLMYDPGQSHTVDQARRNVEIIEKQQSAFMPNFIATLAALQGNYGPAFQLQEQKRKTALGKQLIPTIHQINQLKLRGKWDEAYAIAEQTGASIGQRSPEIFQTFQNIVNDISQKQLDQRNAKDWWNIIGKNMNKSHPDYKVAQSVKAAIDSGTPLAWQMLKEQLSARPHIQNIDGLNIQTSQLTGTTTTSNIPRIAQPRDVDTITGRLIAGRAGISIHDLQNIVNGIAVPGISPERAVQIKDAFDRSTSYQAAVDVGEKLPKEPSLTTQMLSQGVPPLDILTGNIGPQASGVNPAQEAIVGDYVRKENLAAAPIRVNMRENPAFLQENGVVLVDLSTPGPSFGLETPLVPYNQYLLAQDRLAPVRKEVYDKTFKPIVRLKEGLMYLPEMFAAYGDTDKTLDKIEKGLNIALSQRFGIALAPNITVRQAAETIVRGAIERAENIELVDRKEMGQLKQFMVGPFADKNAAIQAGIAVMDRLDNELRKIVPANRIPPNQLEQLFTSASGQGQISSQQPQLQETGRPGPQGQPALQPNTRIQKGYQEHLKKRQGLKFDWQER